MEKVVIHIATEMLFYNEASSGQKVQAGVLQDLTCPRVNHGECGAQTFG